MRCPTVTQDPVCGNTVVAKLLAVFPSVFPLLCDNLSELRLMISLVGGPQVVVDGIKFCDCNSMVERSDITI